MRPPAFASRGRWFRGNLHAHSDHSDGVAPAEQVIAAYRGAGYDFLVLTDHFEARWGWTVTDTSGARDRSFTTLLGAELSSADWDDEDVFWINAIGLPPDFRAPSPGDPHATIIRRAAEAGAYTVLLHPGLTNFLDFDRLPVHHLHAVETYNVNAAHTWPDQAEGRYAVDALLARGIGCTSPSGMMRIGTTSGIASGHGSRFVPSGWIRTRSWTRCGQVPTTPRKARESTTSMSTATACTFAAPRHGLSRSPEYMAGARTSRKVTRT